MNARYEMGLVGMHTLDPLLALCSDGIAFALLFDALFSKGKYRALIRSLQPFLGCLIDFPERRVIRKEFLKDGWVDMSEKLKETDENEIRIGHCPNVRCLQDPPQ